MEGVQRVTRVRKIFTIRGCKPGGSNSLVQGDPPPTISLEPLIDLCPQTHEIHTTHRVGGEEGFMLPRPFRPTRHTHLLKLTLPEQDTPLTCHHRHLTGNTIDNSKYCNILRLENFVEFRKINDFRVILHTIFHVSTSFSVIGQRAPA